MRTMATNLGRFNEQIMNFIGELRGLFPEDKHLETMYFIISFMKKTNPREIIHQFYTHVYPFKKQILARDEQFFLNIPLNDEKIGSLIKQHKLDEKNINTENAISKILDIKHLWTSDKIKPSDKDAIWSYFKVFIYLCDKEYAN